MLSGSTVFKSIYFWLYFMAHSSQNFLRQRQADFYKLKASLVYTARAHLKTQNQIHTL